MLADLPYETVLRLAPVYEAPVYEAQALNRTFGDGISAAIMTDLMRDRAERVLRDRDRQFITLDVDFANREAALLTRYVGVLPAVDTALRAW